jgi:hypothetical protein
MKRINPLSVAAPVAFLLLAAAPKMFSDDYDKKTDVTISEPIQVPGAILQPGKYMFILLNSSSDRHIIEVKSEDGSKLYSMSFATAARRVFPTSDVVLTFYETPEGTPPAVRQWFWPGDYDGQEFLYSHQDALRISAGAGQTVPELTDQEAAKVAAQTPPASSDQTASVQQSSTQSNQSVEQSSVTTEQQSVESNQNQAAVQVAPPADNSNSNTAVQNNPPAEIAQNYTPAPAPAPAPQSPAANSAANDNSALPQTASDIPLIGLIGLVSLISAASLRLARRGHA